MPNPDLWTEDEIAILVFGQTTAAIASPPMRERANELARRIAESLWYGYQLGQGSDALPVPL